MTAAVFIAVAAAVFAYFAVLPDEQTTVATGTNSAALQAKDSPSSSETKGGSRSTKESPWYTDTQVEGVSSSTAALTEESPSYLDAPIVTVPAIAGKTVLDAMRAYQASGNFNFSGTESMGLGFFVESINGKANADGFYWFLYINGTSSNTGASQTKLTGGETVEWKYEKSY